MTNRIMTKLMTLSLGAMLVICGLASSQSLAATHSHNAYAESSAQIAIGSPVSVNVNLYNALDVAENLNVTTEVLDSTGAIHYSVSGQVELGPGEIAPYNTTWTADASGNYTVNTFSANSDSSSRTLLESHSIEVVDTGSASPVEVNQYDNPVPQSANDNSSQPNPADQQVGNPTVAVTSGPAIDQLRQYALNKINKAREDANLTDVRLSLNDAAQNAAIDMLSTREQSYLTTTGEKPYMAYSRLGGMGAVQQNVALTGNNEYYYECLAENPCTSLDPYATIDSQLDIMLNHNQDCCNNTQHDNILNSAHTDVSLGIAYDNYTLALVQNFENNYITFDKPITNDYRQFEFSGATSSGTAVDVRIGYDPMPSSATYNESGSQPYYDSGSLAADVVPPPPAAPVPVEVQNSTVVANETSSGETNSTNSNATQTSSPTDQNATAQANSSNDASSGNVTATTSWINPSSQIASQDAGSPAAAEPVGGVQTITASKWDVNGTSMDIAFDMSPVITEKGVYTIYVILQDDNGNRFNATSYSVYYNG